MLIQLNKRNLKKCEEFADAQLDTSKHLYAYRGEKRIEKIRDDIITGKMGELAACKYLKILGYKSNKPDFEIYKGRRKSFEADLITKCGKYIHVKSQGKESLKRYGASWLLQKSDPIVKESLEDHYILMISVCDLEAVVLGICKVSELHSKDLFGEPKVFTYQRTKKALYLSDIEGKISLMALEQLT